MSALTFASIVHGFVALAPIYGKGLLRGPLEYLAVHETLRITPAMYLCVTEHVWTPSEPATAALGDAAQMQAGQAWSPFRTMRAQNSDPALPISSQNEQPIAGLSSAMAGATC
jgi:hypothetical protein